MPERDRVGRDLRYPGRSMNTFPEEPTREFPCGEFRGTAIRTPFTEPFGRPGGAARAHGTPVAADRIPPFISHRGVALVRSAFVFSARLQSGDRSQDRARTRPERGVHT
ncbi:hypothetical protein GCM10009755_04960 [Brevibacterium samyangense]|uniref:Uncharacterized protein n=1 Tax=Brevibacterium samyangense TaxID=366888 RepID=A0ABP5EMW6_9MICO